MKLAIAVATVPAVALFLWEPMLYGKIAIHVFAVPAFAYPLVYRNSPWRKGPTGKALMNKAISVALLFGLALMKIHRPFTGDDYILAAVVTYLGIAVTYQFLVMLRLKLNARTAVVGIPGKVSP